MEIELIIQDKNHDIFKLKKDIETWSFEDSRKEALYALEYYQGFNFWVALDSSNTATALMLWYNNRNNSGFNEIVVYSLSGNNQGGAKFLMQELQQLSDKERVPICLTSALNAIEFYRKLGFDIVKKSIMIWRPNKRNFNHTTRKETTKTSV